MVIDEKKSGEAEQEYQDALNWAKNEEKKLTAKLKKEGKWKDGLDVNAEYFAYINKELKLRIKEIKKKYNIS